MAAALRSAAEITELLEGWLDEERITATRFQQLEEQVKSGVEKIQQSTQNTTTNSRVSSKTAAARKKNTAKELKEQELNVKQIEAAKRWRELIHDKSDIGIRIYYMADDRICDWFIAPATNRPPPPPPPMPM